MERALRAAGLRGSRLRDLRVLDQTPSRRAGRLRADGFTPAEITAHELRMAVGRTLGWQLLRSTAFTVHRTARGYRFDGVGYGHGVGMCVIGAGRRAARGESAPQILRAYFGALTISGAPPAETTSAAPTARPAPPAVPVAPAPATDVRLALPAAEERDRAVVAGLVRQARADVASRAGVARAAGPDSDGAPQRRGLRAGHRPAVVGGRSDRRPRPSTCCRLGCCASAASSNRRSATRLRTR